MKHLLSFLLVPVLSCGLLNSEELSLAELIDIGLKNNPETEKVWSNVKRAQAVVGMAKSKEYPHLDAQGSVTHAREVKFPNGPDTTFTSYGGELNLNYLLCDFGENRAAVRAAKENLKAARWGADFTLQKVISEVASSYYELLNARELLDTRESSLEDAKMILASAQELRDAGLRSENDFITAKAAVSEIMMNLAQQKAAAAIAYGKLLATLGLPVDSDLDVLTKPEGIQNPLFEEGIEALLAAAQAQRADLMAKQAELASMNARVDRARRAPLPKLRGIGQGGWLEYGKHQGNGYNYSAGLALDVPLFKGFEYTYQKRHALADAEISAAELKELQNAISLEVLSFSERVKAASEAMHYSEEFFADSFKSYESSLESYKAGLINIFDLLLTQRHLADARNRRAMARTEWLVSLSQLAFATGSTYQ
ncbi:MAG: TolC family protein [Verrucomicrobia bacterium]|nr:TolC family protein [Verrucomicrobiota bacterium]